MTGTAAIVARHNPEWHRYELLDGDAVIGKTLYVPFEDAAGPLRIFYHTRIDDAYAGQGLASRLAGAALDGTRQARMRLVPVCPYIKAYLAKHPEYGDLVVAPRPEHLALVP
ncbi:N-acetyltransferase [Zafaria cholistanensis]|uniref:N-acetyltransferase n=1 Tax=Zafaria cholistanensis TaxID=1682741 RepID=A0A5A7NSM1_9MICC|nr:GNAT family N-acetyltransferase [Zafaria cholistanensis]GER23783.1 N-acetyltransferase [Zafaria cholistanensis]